LELAFYGPDGLQPPFNAIPISFEDLLLFINNLGLGVIDSLRMLVKSQGLKLK
jgi:hypothetical protein